MSLNGASMRSSSICSTTLRRSRCSQASPLQYRGQEGPPRERSEGIDRLAEGQSGQSIGRRRGRRRRHATRHPFSSSETGTHFSFVPYRGYGPAHAGFDCRADRHLYRPVTQFREQVRAGVERMPLRRDARLPRPPRSRLSTRRGLPGSTCRSVLAVGAQGHARGCDRQARCRDLTEALDVQPLRTRLTRASSGDFPGAQQTPEALGAFKRPRSNNGGRSSRPRTSRRNESFR